MGTVRNKLGKMKAAIVVSCYLVVGVLQVRALPAQPQHQLSPISHSVSGLSTNLLLSLTEQQAPTQNVIISPVSIFLALSLLYHGSDRSTKTELENFLKLETRAASGLNTRALLEDYAKSREKLNTTIQLANIIFADNSLRIYDQYKRDLQSSLLSGVRKVDFSDQIPTVRNINSWVENKTNNLIKNFISPEVISQSTRLLVLNAIYFKANWKYPFEKYETLLSEKFEVTADSEVEVDMMSKSDDILYQSNRNLQAHVVSLPYEDENFQMMVFLPYARDENSLQNIVRKFSDVDFSEIYESLTEKPVDLYLPKFSIGFKSDLASVLKRNGVNKMFNPNEADFSKISDEALRVSNILHETKIEVTEEGSEAAGITGAVLDLRTVMKGRLEVNINRPFIFVILDLKNNIPLFVGKVVNPSSEAPRQKESVIAVRTSDLLDREDLAHFSLNPEESIAKKNCSTSVDYANTDKIFFPCGSNDTKPIEDYKKEHGDPSLLGVNGEQAALYHI